MVMDVLEKHWMTDVYHENDPRAFKDFEMRDPRTVQSLMKRSHSQVFVVKALCELDMLDELMDFFVPSKTVWVIRHYNDVTNSMVRSFSTSLAWYKAIKQDRASGGWRSRNLSDEHYEWIQEHVNEDSTEQSAAALQWAIRNSLILDKGFEQRDDVLLVFYENLASQPAIEFTRIYDFLALPQQPRTYADVFSGSVGKEPPPAISAGVSSLCEKVWQNLLMTQ